MALSAAKPLIRRHTEIGIFLIGFIAVFASCLRVYFVYQYFNSRDPAFDTIEVRLYCLT